LGLSRWYAAAACDDFLMIRRRDVADDGQDKIVDGLSALGRALVAITARTLASLDNELTLSQYRAMVVLASRGPLRSVDLAAELGLHPSTVSRNCDRLVRRGLLRRHQSADDRRVSRLALSEHGKRLIGEVMRRRTTEIRAVLSVSPVSERTSALRLIHTFVRSAGELPEDQWWTQWSRSTSITGR
jgi:DNA-binding MarR family transcriptional regulator